MVGMLVAMEEVRLPGLMLSLTSVARRVISGKTADERELIMVVTHPRSPKIIFQNG